MNVPGVYVKKETPRPTSKKNGQGTKRLLKQSQHPNEGETGRKSSLNMKWLVFSMMENMANMRVLLMYVVQDSPEYLSLIHI